MRNSDYDYYMQRWIFTNRKDCYPHLKGTLYFLPTHKLAYPGCIQSASTGPGLASEIMDS